VYGTGGPASDSSSPTSSEDDEESSYKNGNDSSARSRASVRRWSSCRLAGDAAGKQQIFPGLAFPRGRAQQIGGMIGHYQRYAGVAVGMTAATESAEGRIAAQQVLRRYATHGWKSTLMVVNAIGHLCEAAWHHPDLAVSYAAVEVSLSTHDAGGITEKDFELARKIEDVVAWRPGEEAGALERLEDFASFHGPDFYGLPRNTDQVVLQRSTWQVPDSLPLGAEDLTPLAAGEQLHWQVIEAAEQ